MPMARNAHSIYIPFEGRGAPAQGIFEYSTASDKTSQERQKNFPGIKWLLAASLRRIEFNKSEPRNSYDHKNHHRSSRYIILYAGIVALFTGTPGASESRWRQKASQHR